jgi:HlyD family secretion protein
MLDTSRVLRRKLFGAILVMVVFGGSVVAWSMLASLEGAIIASGTTQVESHVRKVHAPTGGVISELLVEDGNRVVPKQVLIRFDDTVARANVKLVLGELAALRIRQARLEAERTGRAKLTVPSNLATWTLGDPKLLDMIKAGLQEGIESEQRFLVDRATTRSGQKKSLRDGIEQTRNEIKETEPQKVAIEKQIASQRTEFARKEGLKAQGYARVGEMEAPDREIARAEERIAELKARIANTLGRISDLENRALQIDRDLQTEVSKESREVETEIGKLVERLIAGQDQLSKLEVRAPIAGRVHNLTTYSPLSGYAAPGEVLMEIVPENDVQIVEVKVAPTDIDQVQENQETRIRFPAYHQSATPEVKGRVFRKPANSLREPQTGVTYYLVGIRVEAGELDALRKRLAALQPPEQLQLVAGMPAEAYMKTRERTVASYIMKPFLDQLGKVGRGE